MKLIPSSSPKNSIEPLEGRIAPSVMQIGAIGSGRENRNDTEYIDEPFEGSNRDDAFDDLNFINTSTSPDAISVAVDNAAPNSPNTFYVKLKAGDRIDRFTEINNYQELITVKSGNAIAFFTDLNGDNEYNAGELTGLSLSANAVVEVNGPINGDVVTNLDTKNTSTDADDVVVTNGLVGPKQGIKSLSVIGGAISGSVLSGGDINSLTVRGNVENVLAGTAANGATYDFFSFPLDPTPRFTIGFAADPGIKGANIRNAEIVSVTGRLEAGAGGAGTVGGSLSNIQITGDFDGFSLLAGKGGDASVAAGKANGGAGGSVTKIYVAGVLDGPPLHASNDQVLIKAGAGGSVEPGAVFGKGGTGGAVKDVRVGFEVSGGTILPSTNLLSDNIRVEAGAGGAGLTGAAGGKTSAVNIRVSTPDGLVVGDEIAVLGGAGGAAVAMTGKAGAGGAVDKVEIRNQIATFDTDVLVQAGSAGALLLPGSGATGGAGGAVTNVKLLGSDLRVVAGDGSTGKIGGKGGSVTSVTVLDENSSLTRSLDVHAGFGGDGTAGNAGAGGDISKFQVLNSDLVAMTVNAGNGGNGGNSTGGKGGKGGSATSVLVTDIDSGASLAGLFNLRAGTGGNGDRGGGAGGVVKTLTVEGKDLNATVVAGAGGNTNALGTGRGGAGGALDGVQVVTDGSVAGVNVSGSLAAGAGGNAAGDGQAGGKGGDVRKSQLRLNSALLPALDGNGSVSAGNGGNGTLDSGAAGAGGSLSSALAFAEQGSVTMTAGNAGLVGGKAGAGGSITGTVGAPIGVRGSGDITVRAGDGSFGGAGGSIVNLNYGNGDANSSLVTPPPAGSILMQAGHGSQGATKAGKGGSITSVNGSASSGIDQTVTFLAGDGGGDARPAAAPSIAVASGKAAAGGSITSVTLNRGGALGGLVTFEAGDAGDSALAKTGAAGGQISKISVGDLAPEAVLRSFAAGDGGNAAPVGGKGGKGGSVIDVQVLGHDIGVRTGQYFGYERMGGIFAGTGGDAATDGLAGSVMNISADSIAAIVAGRSDIPQFVEKISDITLNANNQLLFRNNSFVPNSPFELTFNGQTTGMIPANASASQLQAALNSLSGVANAGGITVSSFTGDGGYVIQFGSSQTATIDTSLTAIELELALESMPTVVAKGGVTTTDDAGGVRVRLSTDPAAADVLIPFNATNTQIALALNQTGLNAFGAFGVSVKPDGNFLLSYNTFGVFDQPQFTGREFVPVKVLEKIQGQIGQFLTNEVLKGEFTEVADETRSGSTPLTIQETQRGEVNYFAAEIITGDQTASPPIPELQRISLSLLNSFPSGQFTVSFGGEESAPISISDLNGPKTDLTLRNEIDAALEGLGSVQALIGGTAGNRIVTSIASARTFDLSFSELDGDVEQVVGRVLVPETQRLNLGTLTPVPNGEFQLTFQGESTALLPSTASATAIDDALELLTTIQNLSGTPGDQVVVTETSPGSGIFDITFTSIGNQPFILGDTAVIEIQTLDLSGVLAVPGGTFRLNFDEPSTYVNETTPALSPGVDDAATAVIIQNALNALDSVANSGTNGQVAVTVAGPGQFTITFADNGEQAEIVATAAIFETQNLDLSSINTIQGADFTLDVQTSVPVVETQQYLILESYGADAIPRQGQLLDPEGGPGNQWVTNLINGTTGAPEILQIDRTFLTTNPAFDNEGRITFTFPNPNGPNPLTVTVAGNANAGQLDAAIESIINSSNLDVIITAPGSPNALANAVVPGTFDVRFAGNADRPNLTATAFVPETQRFDLTNTTPDSFTVFHYSNGAISGDTIVLPADPTLNIPQLDAALDAIIPGGVTVTVFDLANQIVDITFNLAADIPDGALTVTHEILENQTFDLSRLPAANTDFTLSFNGLTTPSLPRNADNATIDAAFENLIPGFTLDDVTVNRTGDLVEIAFNSLRGDQVPIVVLARLNGGMTSVLPATADAGQIEAALDLVTIGGVTVTPGLNGTFDIRFGDSGDQPAMVVDTSIHEIQTVDVYDIGQFSLGFGAFGVDVNNNLVTFAPSAPETILTSTAITGLQPGENILGIDFRVTDELIYALGSSNRLYTINAVTGAATQVGSGTFDVALSGTSFGFDFNPAADRIRVVSDAGQNLRIDPTTGVIVDSDPSTAGTQIDTTLAYAPGDFNFGINPNVVAAAYDRNDTDPNTPTTLYGIDTVTGSLVRIGAVDGNANDTAGGGSPNAGVVTTIGFTPLSGTNLTGFDIRDGVGYATQTFGGSSVVFKIDLNTGGTTFEGVVGNGGVALRGMTIGSAPSTMIDPPPRPVNPLAPTVAEVNALNAAAQQLEDVLNARPDIQAVGGVNVIPSQSIIKVNGVDTVVYDDTKYEISFLGDGDMQSLFGRQIEDMTITTTREGGPATSERQEIRYFAKNAFDPAAYAQANLVGAIVDIDEHNANRFHYLDLNNNLTFDLNDQPLDGLVMAKVFDQATVNFTPEARLTPGPDGFFDNDNLL